MAEEDEIDILGEFSFNSCLAQNNQGIPSCSTREDTVHPEWLLDSTSTNWYDKKDNRFLMKEGHRTRHSSWSRSERELLIQEMSKYGRDVRSIAHSLKTKTEAEIQALIEAEYGVDLEMEAVGLSSEVTSDEDDIPSVVQEEIVADVNSPESISQILSMVTTGSPTVSTSQKLNRVLKKNVNNKSKNSLLKPDVLLDIKNNSKTDLVSINSSELLYEDDIVLGSVESVGAPDVDNIDNISRNMLIEIQESKNNKVVKKIGNHRRKCTKKLDKKFVIAPFSCETNNLNAVSDSSKLQIVLGSGQALPISEGEQVIKIEKKKASDSESDIDIDVDVDSHEDWGSAKHVKVTAETAKEVSGTLQQRKFEPMPRRKKRIKFDGGGGCTIMHTESGDLYEIAKEPRKERVKRQQIHLIPCRMYTADNPAPYTVSLSLSALILLDVQTHTSLSEVMGLAGGVLSGNRVRVHVYHCVAAAASRTHCDMCPVAQAAAADRLHAQGLAVVGWHHSHPAFPASPSEQDVSTQLTMQMVERPQRPLLALISSQMWTPNRSASVIRALRIERDVPHRLPLRVYRDLPQRLPSLLHSLRSLPPVSADFAKAICPMARRPHIDKCLSSVAYHLAAAGYPATDPVTEQLMQAVKEVFR